MRHSLQADKQHVNRIAIIATLEQRGLLCGVKEDGAGKFFVQIPKGVTLSEGERAGIDVCRAGLREAWLLERGLCIRCGMDNAKRPDCGGRVQYGVTFNDATKKLTLRWAKCTSIHDTPRYCDACWVQWWSDLAKEFAPIVAAEKEAQEKAKELVNASRKKSRTEDTTSAMQF